MGTLYKTESIWLQRMGVIGGIIRVASMVMTAVINCVVVQIFIICMNQADVNAIKLMVMSYFVGSNLFEQ